MNRRIALVITAGLLVFIVASMLSLARPHAKTISEPQPESTMNTRHITTAALATIASTSALIGDDWPAWGGSDPGRNMYSPAKGIPAKFEPGKFKKNSEEIDMTTTK